jgi:hypothetical protein
VTGYADSTAVDARQFERAVALGTDENDRAQRPNGRVTKAVLLLAMVLAVITAVGGFIAVYKAVFVYSLQ